MSIGSLANVNTMNLLFQNSTFGPSSDCGQVMQNSKVCIPQHQRLLYSGNNVDVYSYYYKDANGALCSWEGVEKQTGAPGSKSSKTTMCTIAVLKRQIRCDCLLLVRQYRAPVGKYTIEFPATVVDGQGNIDHVVEAANREIQDETGYTSTTFKHISPDTAMDADVTDGKVKLVSVSIDGDDPLQHATPANTFSFESGHGHIVQLLQLPLNGLLERLQALAEQDLIDSRVYAYAMGLQEGEKIALSNMLAKEELNEM